jgi:hypothetical protein
MCCCFRLIDPSWLLSEATLWVPRKPAFFDPLRLFSQFQNRCEKISPTSSRPFSYYFSLHPISLPKKESLFRVSREPKVGVENAVTGRCEETIRRTYMLSLNLRVILLSCRKYPMLQYLGLCPVTQLNISTGFHTFSHSDIFI